MTRHLIGAAVAAALLAGCAAQREQIGDEAAEAADTAVASWNAVYCTPSGRCRQTRTACGLPGGAVYRVLGPERFDLWAAEVKATAGTCQEAGR